jgi:hypothetical protein
MSAECCHTYRTRFTGDVVAAQPGFDLVSVAVDPKGEGDDGKGYWTLRDRVHAWAVTRWSMFVGSDPAKRCDFCGERSDEDTETPELTPLVVGEDGVLGRTDGESSDNVTVLGVYPADKNPTAEKLAEAVQFARARMERKHTRADAA